MEDIYDIRDGQNDIFRYINFATVEYFAHRSKVYPIEQGQGATYEPMSLTYQLIILKENCQTQLGDVNIRQCGIQAARPNRNP